MSIYDSVLGLWTHFKRPSIFLLNTRIKIVFLPTIVYQFLMQWERAPHISLEGFISEGSTVSYITFQNSRHKNPIVQKGLIQSPEHLKVSSSMMRCCFVGQLNLILICGIRICIYLACFFSVASGSTELVVLARSKKNWICFSEICVQSRT